MNHQLLNVINENYSQVVRYIKEKLDSRLGRRLSESDILQESYLTAKQSRKRTMSFAFFLKTIDRIVRQKSLKHLMSEDGSLRHEANMSDLKDLPATDDCPSEKDLENQDTAGKIQKLINQLSDRNREILTLVHLRKMTIVQASSYLGISVEAGKKRYQRALSRIRELTTHLRN